MLLCMRVVILLSITTAGAVRGQNNQEESHNNLVRRFTDGCNVTKSCFLIPDTCLTAGICRAGVAVTVTGDRYEFEMIAVNSVYIAVGLSNDAWMGTDSVVECTHDEESLEGSVQAYVSFNIGTSNTRIKTSAAQNGVTLLDGSFVDGVVRCKFTRDQITRAEGVVFDLAKKQYHLLLASGSKLEMSGLAFHDRESAGSHNGRFLGDVGLFVNPDSEKYDIEVEPIYQYEDSAQSYGDLLALDYDFEKTGSTFSTKSCNITKSCFLIPDDCLETDDCRVAVSVMETDGRYEFEMQAIGSAYVAVGISRDSRMGSDSVVECVSDVNSSSGVGISAYTSWNKGHKNHRIQSPLSKCGIALIDGSSVDGTIFCKFTRDGTTKAEGVVFDLPKNEFHILLASGSKLKEDGIGFHNHDYAASHNGRLLADVGMFRHRRDMIDDPSDGSYEIVDSFQPIVIII